jgi:acyl-CoA synthetase (AMP-forming)/AMP-acid ligase II
MTTFAEANRVFTADAETTVGALRALGRERFGRWAGERVALSAEDPAVALAAVLAAADAGFELAVVPDERFDHAWRARLGELMTVVVGVDEERGAGPPAESAGLVLFTSGSTGEPRAVRHSFDTLDTFGSVTPEPHRWLVTYLPGTYAWVQVVLLGLTVPGQDLVFARSREPADLLAALERHAVTATSSTPTLWRYLLAVTPAERLASLPLRQITLGGERVDQPLLDELCALFPRARLTHIFATTEAGPAFAVSDGRAGFPASFLDEPQLAGAVSLRIREGTLHVASRYSHRGADEWIDTGDLVEVAGDRVLVRGRREHDHVNVGGVKVSKSEVEDFVRGIPGVVWARAVGERAPLVGELVGLELVVEPEAWEEADKAEEAVVAACAARFPEEAVPRRVRFLDEVPLDEAGKTRV